MAVIFPFSVNSKRTLMLKKFLDCHELFEIESQTISLQIYGELINEIGREKASESKFRNLQCATLISIAARRATSLKEVLSTRVLLFFYSQRAKAFANKIISQLIRDGSLEI